MNYNPFYYLERMELMHYEHAWVNFVKKGLLVETTIQSEVLDSWARCKKNDVNVAIHSVSVTNINNIEIKYRKLHEIINIAIPIMKMLIRTIEEKEISAMITDNEGYMLWSQQKNRPFTETEDPYKIGLNANENNIGTNGFDLTIRHEKPFEVVGAMHYCEVLQNRAEYVAPVMDKYGDLSLTIGISIGVEKSNRYILGTISAAAKAIENEYQLKEVHSQLMLQNEIQKNILDSVTDGIVYIDEKNRITQANTEMSKMTGLSKEYLIGKNISIIHTEPRINSVIASIRKGKNVGRILINGRMNSYNCIMTYRYIKNSENQSSSHVLFFTRYEEIQELADKMSQENRAFFTFDDIIGKSTVLADAIELAKKAARHNVRIIIEGESGTGKEMFAQAIHNCGLRKKGPFVAVDCGAIPRELLESELFGYVEGAYTGSRKGGHRGKFQVAHGGTLFLDEISNMPFDMQSKLLRVLQENKIVKIGGHTPINIDVQIIAATNKDLLLEVEKGNFREDLFYRLNTVYIRLPALRDRKEDVPILIKYMIKNLKSQHGKLVKGINEKSCSILTNYDWPGNVRQLSNVIERMILISEKDLLTEDLIPEEIIEDSISNDGFEMLSKEIEPLDSVTAKYIKHVIDSYGGNIKKASEVLQISRSTIYRVLKKDDSM